jgi:CRISPR-associated endonuclease Csn1
MHFGENNWNKKTEDDKKEYFDYVLEKYLKFLEGTQLKEEKASSRQGKNPEIDYYLVPRLDEAIKKTLKQKYRATDEGLKCLYHPSDIDIYPNSKKTIDVVDKITGEIKKIPQLDSPEPPSKGWKNPMAMRTMYELKKLVNYLLKVGKIDVENKIVIEIARELNDTNKRWAIQEYQKRREEENKEFAKAILGVAKEKYPNLNEQDAENINKVRLWWEQLENGEEIYEQVKKLKEDVDKYRLWKEQNAICLYTGKTINITDLFDGDKIHFEHTFPISISFDNSLSNKTVCFADYNTNFKKKRIPSDLENYDKKYQEYPPIKNNPILQKWIKKRELLQMQIDKNKLETKKASGIGDIERKNELIRKRHILKFEFEYWDKKVKTFTLNEIPSYWKNSQLVDTQIITKYARAYLKSVFQKVEVIKAKQNTNDTQDGMVNIFKKIYEIKGDEQKDRSRHSHHAMDAAVLTLIPGSAQREKILEEYYSALERKEKFHDKPYPAFDITHISRIDENILINHIIRDKALVPTKKKLRKRGKIQLTKNRTPMIMQGDSIRGQLHKETYLGCIIPPYINQNKFQTLEKEEFKVEEENEILQKKFVVRVPLTGFTDLNDLETKIVDKGLFKMIKNQIGDKDFREALEDGIFMFNKKGEIVNKIRRVRIFVPVNAIAISFISDKEHKQFYYADSGDNYRYLLFEGTIKNKIKRKFLGLKLFDIANKNKIELLNKSAIHENLNLSLHAKIKKGTKLFLYKDNKDELKKLDIKDLMKRFVIVKYFRTDDGRICTQNHIEARKDNEIKEKPSTKVDFENPKPRYLFSPSNFKFAIEGKDKDFVMMPDGEIIWKF